MDYAGGKSLLNLKRPIAAGLSLIACLGLFVLSPGVIAKPTQNKKGTSSSASEAPAKKKGAAKPAGNSDARSLGSKEAAEAPVSIPTDPAGISLIAKGAIVIDGLTGEEIYGKDADERQYPASATKILTALLVIEAGDLDKIVDIELADTQVEPSAIYFKPGDQHTRRELLYALLLKSANDAAQALARDNAGSIAAFAEKMTRRAQQLGALDSHFMNPHGLHNPEHYTTPRDLALIGRAAMQLPTFRHYVGTQEWQWHGSQGIVSIKNHNKLLRTLPGCTGLKTGYTVKAQHVLVSAAIREDREVICAVMHSDKPGKWTDSKILLGYGLEHLPAKPDLLFKDEAAPQQATAPAPPSTPPTSTVPAAAVAAPPAR